MRDVAEQIAPVSRMQKQDANAGNASKLPMEEMHAGCQHRMFQQALAIC